jgi:hypothetical protein
MHFEGHACKQGEKLAKKDAQNAGTTSLRMHRLTKPRRLEEVDYGKQRFETFGGEEGCESD